MQPETWPAPARILAMVAAFALSALITWLGIAYAHRRKLIDQPGARRSHKIPTPRGGGIGIVIAVLEFVCVPALVAGGVSIFASICLTVAIVLVAAAGWIDDHRGLAARWRFLTHCVAAIVLLLPIIVPLILAPVMIEDVSSLSSVRLWALVGIAALLIVWFVNLHNFMDGIDGILAAQAVFVFSSLSILCFRAGATAHAGELAVFAAATAGFLPFNFPRARIFMGDVGSGVIGLLIALAVLWQMAGARSVLASGLILCSAFVTDATCTLVSRMLRGRRWYSAHREHLYQWLVRSGFSHAGVVGLYTGWNLVIVVPVVAWINQPEPPMPYAPPTFTPGFGAAAGVYLLGIVVWLAGKRWCLLRSAHAAA